MSKSGWVYVYIWRNIYVYPLRDGNPENIAVNQQWVNPSVVRMHEHADDITAAVSNTDAAAKEFTIFIIT